MRSFRLRRIGKAKKGNQHELNAQPKGEEQRHTPVRVMELTPEESDIS